MVFDGNGDLSNRYLYGPAVDQILADEQLDSLTTPGDVLWPLTDNLGTVRDLAAYDDSTGDTTVVNHRTYTAFGQILSETDPTIHHRFAYTGRHWDDDAGLYHYRARWYDPALGRFLSEDPIGFEAGDANLQRYVGNGPTTKTDPSGLETEFAEKQKQLREALIDIARRSDSLRRLAQDDRRRAAAFARAYMEALCKLNLPALIRLQEELKGVEVFPNRRSLMEAYRQRTGRVVPGAHAFADLETGHLWAPADIAEFAGVEHYLHEFGHLIDRLMRDEQGEVIRPLTARYSSTGDWRRVWRSELAG